MHIKFPVVLGFLLLLLVQTVTVSAYHIPGSSDTVKTTNMMFFPTAIAPTIDGTTYNIKVIAVYLASPSNELRFAQWNRWNLPRGYSRYAFVVVGNDKSARNYLPPGTVILNVNGTWLRDEQPSLVVRDSFAGPDDYFMSKWLELYLSNSGLRTSTIEVDLHFHRSDLLMPGRYEPKVNSVPFKVIAWFAEDRFDANYIGHALGSFVFQWDLGRFPPRLAEVTYGYAGAPIDEPDHIVGEGFESPGGSVIRRILRMPGSVVLTYAYDAAICIDYDAPGCNLGYVPR